MSSKHLETQPVADRSPMFDDAVNTFSVIGMITHVNQHPKSGTTIVTFRAGSMPDQDVPGTDGERRFTSRFLIRIPPRLKERWHDELLEGPGMILRISGRLSGVVDNLDGEDFFTTQLVAQDIRFIARHGQVHVKPGSWKPPVKNAQTRPGKKPAGASGGNTA